MLQRPLQRTYSYVIVLFFITLLLRALLAGYYNNNLGGIEPNVIYGIQRILMGQPLYQNPATNTYAVIQYTPFHYYFVAGIAKIVGIHGLNVRGIYMLCRILAILFNLLMIAAAAIIIRSMGFAWKHSLLFAMPVFMVLTSHFYTRGDSMYLLLFVAAVYFLTAYSKKGQLPYLLLAALSSALCVITKQTGMLAVGILGFCLLFVERKILHTLLYAAVTFTFALVFMYLFTAGDWHSFYLNGYMGLKNGTDLSFLYNIFISPFFLDLVPFYVLGGIMVWAAVNQITDKTFRILAYGAALSFLFGVVTGLKIGSSNNYLTEFLVLAIMALPSLLESDASNKVLFTAFRFSLTVRKYAWFAFFVLITSKTMGLFTAVFIDKSFKNYRSEYANEELMYTYFKDELKIKNGEHIFFTERRFLDNLFFEYSILPVKDVTTQVYLANPATFDYSGFRSGMNNGLVNYIVTDDKRDDINICHDSLPFVLFYKTKFKLITKKFGYAIYVYMPQNP